uniref:ATP synthase complex subunit 8 n=1 Tax=Teslasena femoralis TaxID=1622175 RepID=A0A0H3UL16_9COLE|nr:ATP synthase F0 subunit 8 [Teslasena femoralis]
MPQMAPLSWLNLFMFFVMVFIMMNALNYFSFSYHPMKKILLKKKTINWKW